jgi:aminocarboxymuconate-semialdehyde decarboxylase
LKNPGDSQFIDLSSNSDNKKGSDMASRRQFIKRGALAVNGIVMVGCGVHSPVRAPQAGTAPRAPLVLNGAPVRTVDVHAHCMIPQALALMGLDVFAIYPKTMHGGRENVVVISERLAAMDAQGVDMEVLSINPFWYEQARELSARIVRLQNDKLAELCAARPDRFAAFASLSLQHPDLAVQELEYAVNVLRLRGAAIGGNVAGADFADPRFHPVWAKAEELGATLFIHPTGTPELARRFAGNGWMPNVIGYPLETTIALQHLIFEGVLDKFPALKICSAHGGGYIATSAARMDHGCFVNPGACAHGPVLKKKPSQYVNQLFFDSLVFTPQALANLVRQVGVSQVMLGSDHPFPWSAKPVQHVLDTPELSDADKAAVLGGNARRVLGL